MHAHQRCRCADLSICGRLVATAAYGKTDRPEGTTDVGREESYIGVAGIRSDFEKFAERELPGLLRYAAMLTGDRELARDLVQDVMLKAHRHWDKVWAADHPSLYVKTMITRTRLSWLRRWSVRNVMVGYDGVVSGADAPDHADVVVDRHALWARMAELPHQQRAVLVLRYYEHLTDAEIADVLNCTAGTVRGMPPGLWPLFDSRTSMSLNTPRKPHECRRDPDRDLQRPRTTSPRCRRCPAQYPGRTRPWPTSASRTPSSDLYCGRGHRRCADTVCAGSLRRPYGPASTEHSAHHRP
jgi:RNA polymerase sigma factor (sigma-70 family)